jgi:hypothetical protein
MFYGRRREGKNEAIFMYLHGSTRGFSGDKDKEELFMKLFFFSLQA